MSNNNIKTIAWIEGSIECKNGSDIDLDKLQEDFCTWVESKGLLFCGATRHMTEEENK